MDKGNKQASQNLVHFAWQPLLLYFLYAIAQGKDQSLEDFSEDLLMNFGSSEKEIGRSLQRQKMH